MDGQCLSRFRHVVDAQDVGTAGHCRQAGGDGTGHPLLGRLAAAELADEGLARDAVEHRPAEAEEKTASGLVIPDTAKEKPQQGEVLAVGPGRRSDSGELIPLDINVGDTVVYSKYGGTEVSQDGEDVLILSGRDILAIVK